MSRPMSVALVCLAFLFCWFFANAKVERPKGDQIDAKVSVAADEAGIHFFGGPDDNLVDWGEIESVHAARFRGADGVSYLEVFVDHISGVDFRFQDVEEGYDQVISAMEQHLIGFRRASLEAVEPFETAKNLVEIWKRNQAIQPFHLRPPEVDNRDPTAEERVLVQSAHKATIATCERVLGRELDADELRCISTRFENGRISGAIASPLCERLVRRQSETLGRPVGK
jgi:hypothetical protein